MPAKKKQSSEATAREIRRRWIDGYRDIGKLLREDAQEAA